MESVYDILAQELEDEFGPTENTDWKSIVLYLNERGVLDYDILKEVLLDEEDGED